MKYEFQSMLFRTQSEMCDAIAEEWITAGGLNDGECVAALLAGTTDQELARDCVAEWRLDQPSHEWSLSNDGDDAATWLDARGIDAADIAAAFARMRG